MGVRRTVPRSSLPAHKLAALRAQDALRKRMKRRAMTAEQRRAERAKDKERKAAKRRAQRAIVRLPSVAALLAGSSATASASTLQSASVVIQTALPATKTAGTTLPLTPTPPTLTPACAPGRALVSTHTYATIPTMGLLVSGVGFQ